MSCALCNDPLPVIKRLYKDTKKFVVLDCMTCNLPMIVWKEHTMTVTQEMKEEMTNELKAIADEKFKKYMYYIDKKQNTIFDHLHWHARPTGWTVLKGIKK